MPLTPTEALHRAVKEIPEGTIRATAEAAQMSHTELAKLRRGENLNIGIIKLARLCDAMGKSADELIGRTPPDPRAAKDAAERAEAEKQAKAHRRLVRLAKMLAAEVATQAEGEPR